MLYIGINICFHGWFLFERRCLGYIYIFRNCTKEIFLIAGLEFFLRIVCLASQRWWSNFAHFRMPRSGNEEAYLSGKHTSSLDDGEAWMEEIPHQTLYDIISSRMAPLFCDMNDFFLLLLGQKREISLLLGFKRELGYSRGPRWAKVQHVINLSPQINFWLLRHCHFPSH